MMMRTVATRVCIGLVLFGCSSFTSTPPSVSPTDDGGVDAVLDAGSAGDATDGAMLVDPASSYCSSVSSSLCADLENGTTFGGWGNATVTSEPSVGRLARDETSGHDSGFGLHATLLAGTASGVSFELRASSGNKVFLEADIRIRQPLTGLDGLLTVVTIKLGDTSVSATIGTGASDDCLLRLHTTSTAFTARDGLVARVPYGKWVRVRLESDLVGTTSDGSAHLHMLLGGSIDPGDQTMLQRITVADGTTVSVAGLVRSDSMAATGAVEADFDNLVGGSF